MRVDWSKFTGPEADELKRKLMMDQGTDYAYSRLVRAARETGIERVREIAWDLLPDVVQGCAGMAYADIENAMLHSKSTKPYEIIIEVANELRQKTN